CIPGAAAGGRPQPFRLGWGARLGARLASLLLDRRPRPGEGRHGRPPPSETRGDERRGYRGRLRQPPVPHDQPCGGPRRAGRHRDRPRRRVPVTRWEREPGEGTEGTVWRASVQTQLVWYAEVGADTTTIWANFQDAD